MKEIKNIHLESFYLQGARDVLLRLKDDFDMYLIPSIKCKAIPSSYLPEDATNEMWFPLNNTYIRKLVGNGLLNALLSDRESLIAFLYGQYKELQVKSVKRGKKAKHRIDN